MTNKEVIWAWLQGVNAASANLVTDGQDLRAFSLLIGYTDLVSEAKVVIVYRGKYSISRTITHYISETQHLADDSRLPTEEEWGKARLFRKQS